MQNVRLRVLVGMDFLQPVKQRENLRHVIRPRGDMHFTVTFDNLVKMALTHDSQQLTSSLVVFFEAPVLARASWKS